MVLILRGRKGRRAITITSDTIREMFRLIDWMMRLSQRFETQFKAEICPKRWIGFATYAGLNLKVIQPAGGEASMIEWRRWQIGFRTGRGKLRS